MDMEELCHDAPQKVTFVDEYIHYLQLGIHHSQKETEKVFISELFTLQLFG